MRLYREKKQIPYISASTCIIYNSRNYKGVLICSGKTETRVIYISRNYKGVLIDTALYIHSRIYNSRNYKGVLIVVAVAGEAVSTTVEIIREY